MRSVNEIAKAWDDGEYESKVPYPEKEEFVEDIDETVRKNMERKEALKTKHSEALKAYRISQAEAMDRLQKDCIAAEMGYGLNEEQVTIIWDNAYEEKHSYMCDVFGYFESQCELVRKVLNAENEKEEKQEKDCQCAYSKAMNQPYPRRCVHCGKPETIQKESNRGKS